MPIAKLSGGKDFTPLPSGTHLARCMAVISLGTQASPMYPSSFKVMLMFEVPGETVVINDKPAPMVTQKEYTLSLSEKANLRHHLESWRGRQFTKEELDGFDVVKVLGQPCMISVVHKSSAAGKVYANISGISGVPKGVSIVPAWHKPISYEIEQGQNDVFKALPEWIQKKIAMCEEWTLPAAGANEPESAMVPDPQSNEGDNEVPF